MRLKTSHGPTASTFVLAGAALLSSMVGARSETYDPNEQRGRALAQANCATCHAVGPTGVSPLTIAPPFRTLHERYPVEDLAESLAEGIVTGHPTMPQFQLESDQIGDLIAYLKALER